MATTAPALWTCERELLCLAIDKVFVSMAAKAAAAQVCWCCLHWCCLRVPLLFQSRQISDHCPACFRFSFHVLMWEVFTGEKPKRGSLRTVRVPDECPQVGQMCGVGAVLAG